MPGRRISLDEWWNEQLAADPRIEKDPFPEPRRGRSPKVDILVDENLEGLVADLQTVGDFRVHVERRHQSDEHLWRAAQQNGWFLVTRDLDFWDESRFPLRLSPGVVILRGRTLDACTGAFAFFSVHSGLLWRSGRQETWWMTGFKAKASQDTIDSQWFMPNGDIIVDRFETRRRSR